MAVSPKLSKDEQWLEDTFKVDIAKFDKDLQSGGKKHDPFLKDVARLHIRVDNFSHQHMSKLMHLKSDNPKFKKAQQQADTAFDKMVASIKKGDIAAAVRFSADTRDALIDMGTILNEGQKRIMTLPAGGNLESLGGAVLGLGNPATQKASRR